MNLQKPKYFPVRQDSEACDGVLLSSRVRLARNLKKYPFPHQLGFEEAEGLAADVLAVLEPKISEWAAEIFLMDTLNPLTRDVMVENHIISPEFAEEGTRKVLVCLKNRNCQLFVNEEDHIRFQVIARGYDFERYWNILDDVDDFLSDRLEFAFDPLFGFLTSCPTNAGTGLRVSVLLCLPGLSLTKQLRKVFSSVSRIGLVIRGFYGEGSGSLGNIYQLSTGSSLGRSEPEILESFYAVVKNIAGLEEEQRYKLSRSLIEKRIRVFFRMLRRLAMITSGESIEFISLLILGKKLGIIQIEEAGLIALLYRLLPATMQAGAGRILSASERDVFRASLILEEMEKNNAGF